MILPAGGGENHYIFDRFYRVNSARSRKKGGSGLELAIAMAIANSHSGYIQARSELGQGSTFTIKPQRRNGVNTFAGDEWEVMYKYL